MTTPITSNRQLLTAFAEFQWKQLPLDVQLEMEGTVFNMRTIDTFLSQFSGEKEQQGEAKICKCTDPDSEIAREELLKMIEERIKYLKAIGKRGIDERWYAGGADELLQLKFRITKPT